MTNKMRFIVISILIHIRVGFGLKQKYFDKFFAEWFNRGYKVGNNKISSTLVCQKVSIFDGKIN